MRDKLGGTTVYKPANVLIEHLGSDTPKLTDQKDGVTHTVICDYVAEELIYANHWRGFPLCSMRSMTRSR